MIILKKVLKKFDILTFLCYDVLVLLSDIYNVVYVTDFINFFFDGDRYGKKNYCEHVF